MHMGDDSFVCDMARVSFSKLAKDYPDEKNNRLINYLARHNHWSPFAHPQITLHTKVPIFVARQDFKHIVGFVRNEVSRRYVDDDPEFFKPDKWRARPDGSVKQGSGGEWEHSEQFDKDYSHVIRASENFYRQAIQGGLAPELARSILPQSMYTEYYVTGSLAAFARAYNQRIDPHAQKEIQDLAKRWDEIIRPLYPESWAALTRPESYNA